MNGGAPSQMNMSHLSVLWCNMFSLFTSFRQSFIIQIQTDGTKINHRIDAIEISVLKCYSFSVSMPVNVCIDLSYSHRSFCFSLCFSSCETFAAIWQAKLVSNIVCILCTIELCI